eukprot:4319586-Pyramimonas_sp.AAC.1
MAELCCLLSCIVWPFALGLRSLRRLVGVINHHRHADAQQPILDCHRDLVPDLLLRNHGWVQRSMLRPPACALVCHLIAYDPPRRPCPPFQLRRVLDHVAGDVVAQDVVGAVLELPLGHDPEVEV